MTRVLRLRGDDDRLTVRDCGECVRVRARGTGGLDDASYYVGRAIFDDPTPRRRRLRLDIADVAQSFRDEF